ncbi:flagellin [Gemmata sp. JC673]|uniref:Flagellin n=1 Tax=Gemmata algarum TaxID=2975278 RepID=A0ABU5F5Q9_9BACT|nr:flagellin [Gemmata algarum]MDY3562519.1 flagellin [Gemmata algarum]
MALTVVNNTASLNAQQNLGRASSALNTSLERLSTGLKVNRGADGPSALVISETQRAQIAGLKTALDNTNKAVSLVQTAEGALNEINSLLTKARSLALDSANSGVNDATALAANQAEITNILSSIDNIAATTKFGTKALLNGAATNGALATTQSGVVISGTLAATPPLTSYNTVTVTQRAVRAQTTGSGAGATIGTSGNLSVNGINVALLSTDTIDQAVAKLNSSFNANSIKLTADNVGGQIRFTATDFKTDVVIGAGTAGTTSGAGLTAGTYARTAATVTYTNSLAATVTQSGTATAGTNGNGGSDASAVALTGELAGATVTLGLTAGSTINSVLFTNGTFVVGQNLQFQTGANSGETSLLSIGRTNSNFLGNNSTASSTFTSLNAIDVTTSSNSTAAITVIDKAISDISTTRANLGAFQANSLESNARSLQATLENTTAAQSIIRDTDFASEIANFTRLQTQVQAGATVLGNANQTTQLVAQLLRG